MSSGPEDQAREKIEQQLQAVGWEDLDNVTGGTGFKREYETDSGPADYALFLNT